MQASDTNHSRSMRLYGCLGILFVLISAAYLRYILIAKSVAPIMDFWHWIRLYGEKLQNGTITFWDFFLSDAGNHMQPFCMALQFYVLKLSQFDVQPLVVWGAIFRIGIAGAAAFLFLRHYKETGREHPVLLVVFSAAIIMTILNYNAWEMTIEPFSLGNAVRVLLYLLSFLFAGRFLQRMPERSMGKNLLCAAGLGFLCAFLTIFVGSAYFIGHLPAIGLALVFVFFCHLREWKQYFIPFFLWFVLSLAGALVYYWLYTAGGRAEISAGMTFDFLELLRGMVIYWGSLFVPLTWAESRGPMLTYLLGAATIVYIVVILVLYVSKKDRVERNAFPVICVLYAMLVGIGIAAGRTGSYGADVMYSSRYVIETSIGLLGLIVMTYEVAVSAQFHAKGILKYWSAAAVTLLLLLLGNAGRVEHGIAPARAAYNQQIVAVMQDIDQVTEEEAAVTQASLEDVRYCVEFFKANHLSIFSDETAVPK